VYDVFAFYILERREKERDPTVGVGLEKINYMDPGSFVSAYL
jgi:hypothetical protein